MKSARETRRWRRKSRNRRRKPSWRQSKRPKSARSSKRRPRNKRHRRSLRLLLIASPSNKAPALRNPSKTPQRSNKRRKIKVPSKKKPKHLLPVLFSRRLRLANLSNLSHNWLALQSPNSLPLLQSLSRIMCRFRRTNSNKLSSSPPSNAVLYLRRSKRQRVRSHPLNPPSRRPRR